MSLTRSLLAGAVAFALLPVAGCGESGSSSTPTVSPSVSVSVPTASASTSTAVPSSASPTPSPTTPPASVAGLVTVPLYWIGEAMPSIFLYREFVKLPDDGGKVRTAVLGMMSTKPTDPDLVTFWSKPSRLDVVQNGQNIVVDVSKDAFANTDVGSGAASLSLQQLVYTATGAAQSSGTVTILVDGGPAEVWGVVSVGDPMKRDPSVRAPIWIEAPREGAVLPAGKIVIKGFANVFEGHVNLEILDADGQLVVQTFATGAMGSFGPFVKDVTLPPGSYRLLAYAPDMSDGESGAGPRLYETTVEFTVK